MAPIEELADYKPNVVNSPCLDIVVQVNADDVERVLRQFFKDQLSMGAQVTRSVGAPKRLLPNLPATCLNVDSSCFS